MAYDKGQKVMVPFFEQRLLKTKVVFYVLLRLRLRMFMTVLHLPKTRTTRSPIVAQSDRSLFSQLSVVAQTRSLKLEEVFCFELGSLPWSLASFDEGLQKTAKAKMMQLLDKSISPAQPPGRATVIYDFDEMALLQVTKPSGTTYAHLALQQFAYVTQGAFGGDRLIQRSQSRIGREFDVQQL